MIRVSSSSNSSKGILRQEFVEWHPSRRLITSPRNYSFRSNKLDTFVLFAFSSILTLSIITLSNKHVGYTVQKPSFFHTHQVISVCGRLIETCLAQCKCLSVTLGPSDFFPCQRVYSRPIHRAVFTRANSTN